MVLYGWIAQLTGICNRHGQSNINVGTANWHAQANFITIQHNCTNLCKVTNSVGRSAIIHYMLDQLPDTRHWLGRWTSVVCATGWLAVPTY